MDLDPIDLDPKRVFSIKDRTEIWKRDRGICGLCRRKVNLKKTNGKWNADHIIPWSLGGRTSIENGQVSHPLCNKRKYTDPNYEDVGWNRNWRAWWELMRLRK